jgi:hypothetical protein
MMMVAAGVTGGLSQIPCESRAYDRCDLRTQWGLAEIHSELQLHAALAAAPVTDVQRVPTRVGMSVGSSGEATVSQALGKQVTQLQVEPAHVYVRSTDTAVDPNHDAAAGGEGYAVRVVESVTRDVQAVVLAASFESFKDVEVVIAAGDQSRKLRGSGLDAAAVRCHDEYRRAAALVHLDAIARARCLVSDELGE